jgi:hypothetical protein
MSDESFAAALRAELDAVVARYEALVRALASLGGRETDALRAEAARLASENQRLTAAEADRKAEVAALTARVAGLSRDLDEARARADRLEIEARAALDATMSYEEQFAGERRFVEAGRDLGGSLLGEALAAAVGRALEPGSATFAVLKARGLETALVAAVRDRGRSAVSAPLLDRERTALAALAAAAGAELLAPPPGTRFSAASMEKASAVSEPAEEGNVVACAMPGLRRAGTDGALVFPRVVVATG